MSGPAIGRHKRIGWPDASLQRYTADSHSRSSGMDASSPSLSLSLMPLYRYRIHFLAGFVRPGTFRTRTQSTSSFKVLPCTPEKPSGEGGFAYVVQGPGRLLRTFLLGSRKQRTIRGTAGRPFLPIWPWKLASAALRGRAVVVEHPDQDRNSLFSGQTGQAMGQVGPHLGCRVVKRIQQAGEHRFFLVAELVAQGSGRLRPPVGQVRLQQLKEDGKRFRDELLQGFVIAFADVRLIVEKQAGQGRHRVLSVVSAISQGQGGVFPYVGFFVRQHRAKAAYDLWGVGSLLVQVGVFPDLKGSFLSLLGVVGFQRPAILRVLLGGLPFSCRPSVRISCCPSTRSLAKRECSQLGEGDISTV